MSKEWRGVAFSGKDREQQLVEFLNDNELEPQDVVILYHRPMLPEAPLQILYYAWPPLLS